jgi:hypothetical protein
LAIFLSIAYAVLLGIRLGLSTAHDSVAATLGLDAGVIVFILLVAAVGTWMARRRRSPTAIPPSTARIPTIGRVSILVGVAVVSSLIGRNVVSVHSRGIVGAPGYTTYGGPHGYPLGEGKPWGTPCQPLRFSVTSNIPTTDYDQIAAVVRSARADGIDVTIESRSFVWFPSQLYPAGQTNATVKRIPIFASSASPPKLSNGHLERIGFGWDAAVSPDGRHEQLTDLQATLYLSQLEGHPDRLRIAIRQFIAFSQGVGGSSAADSGISRGTTRDSFSPADLHAMGLMSGCDYQSGPPAPPAPASS